MFLYGSRDIVFVIWNMGFNMPAGCIEIRCSFPVIMIFVLEGHAPSRT